MLLGTVLIILLFISSTSCQNCPEKGISSHKIINKNGYRLATMRNGNYTIQGLMTFTGKDCVTVNADGLVRAYAMKYGIDKSNKEHSLVSPITIGYHLDNVCFDLTRTMARGIELVSLHRPNSVCRSDFLKCDPTQNISYYVKAPVAVVGTLRSATTIPLAGLMALYYIPQVSYSASSRILSRRSLYKSFFRTVPSDTNQIKVMLDVMEKFNWNYVFAIGSDDDYGKLGVAELKQHSHARNICVTNDEYILSDSVNIDKRIDVIIEKIKQDSSIKVVVLFCYAEPIGIKILQKAQLRGLERVWLTSESWNPYALKLNVSNAQKIGILTVSLKTYSAPYLDEYIKNEIQDNFKCDMWLQNYLENNLKCIPTHLSDDKSLLYGVGKGCPLKIVDIMKKLSGVSGSIQNLVDAVHSLILAIKVHLQDYCSGKSDCSLDIISPGDVTKAMYNVSFTNEHGNLVSFDKYGNPKYAFYTVENIQLKNDTFKYIPVGNWSSARNSTHKLEIDVRNIKWPLWFDRSGKDRYPFSRCNKDCEPGERVVGKQLCCWNCQKCCGNTISNVTNALSCTQCAKGHHAVQNFTKCEVTPIHWLCCGDAIGMSIIVISGIGFLVTFISTSLLISFKKSLVMEHSLSFVILCSVLLHVTFAYTFLYVTKPSEYVCPAVNSVFFLLLMLFTSIVMIKINFFSHYVVEHLGKLACGHLVTAQLITVFAMFLIEVVTVVIWFMSDPGQAKHVEETLVSDVPPLVMTYLRCGVDSTAGWYVSIFIPISFLLFVSFRAFNERNCDHYFHEPKFLSFACIAMCIIIAAYIPSYGYAEGKNKALISAVTLDLFAFTLISCLIIPRVRVALLVHKFGLDRFPLRRESGLPQKSDIISRISIAMSEPIVRKLKDHKHNLPPIEEASSSGRGSEQGSDKGSIKDGDVTPTFTDNNENKRDESGVVSSSNMDDSTDGPSVDNDPSGNDDTSKGYVNEGAELGIDCVD